MSKALVSKILRIEPHEASPALLAAAYYFCVLCAYYVIRPIRDERGIAAGADNLPWIMWLTLGATLLITPAFGWLVRGRSRGVFIPTTYRFFAVTFLAYGAINHQLDGRSAVWLGIAFFVWVSVFNLFANSLVWAFMADGFRYEQSKRVFGLVAIGGTLGAIAGSAFTHSFSAATPLALIAACALLLEAACQLVRLLAPRFDAMRREHEKEHNRSETPVPPVRSEKPVEPDAGVWRGLQVALRSPYLLSIAGYLFLYTITSTLLYFQQAHIVEASFTTRESRITYFAAVDLWVNVLTLLGQLFLTARVMSTFGVAATLAFLPAVTLVGFFAVGADPTLTPFVVFYVLRRAANYAISRPARETLFTVVPRAARYQSKTFLDTFVYRAGDAIASPIDFAFRQANLTVSGAAYAAAPIAVAWLCLAVYLGRRQKALARQKERGERGDMNELLPPQG